MPHATRGDAIRTITAVEAERIAEPGDLTFMLDTKKVTFVAENKSGVFDLRLSWDEPKD